MSTPVSLRPLTNINIAITGKCNLACKYCFYADEMTSRSDLSTDKWLAFMDELGRQGVMTVCLTGGEVFTRRDLFEIIDGLIANHMRYQILTNGTLITEKILKQFEVGKRRQRLDSIQVSIDGSSAEIHDLSRPNSFERAVRGLRLLKEAGFPVTVRVTVNHNNLNDLENVAKLLLDEIGLRSFSTNEAFSMGAGCHNTEQIGLSSPEKLQAMHMFDELLERYPGRITATAGPIAKRIAYAEMRNAQETGEKTSRWGMGYLTGCGCVFSKLSILHDGTVVPCHVLGEISLGNIANGSINDIWHNNSAMNALRERRNIPMTQVAGCETCEWNAYCNGSCPGIAFQATGDLNRANPEDCYRKFLFETEPLHAG